MQINLKTTILLSSALAGLLNLGDFAVGIAQHRDAFFNGWVYADSSNAPVPQSTPAKLLALPPISPTTPASAASSAQPTSDSAAVAAALTRAGLKPEFAPIYLRVQQQTGTPWQLLAAVHRIETGQSGNTARKSYAGAVGPMQFMPATFSKYGADGDGNGTKDITDVDDAITIPTRSTRTIIPGVTSPPFATSPPSLASRALGTSAPLALAGTTRSSRCRRRRPTTRG
jgi:soluble lytic murein transglycosylase-like protein